MIDLSKVSNETAGIDEVQLLLSELLSQNSSLINDDKAAVRLASDYEDGDEDDFDDEDFEDEDEDLIDEDELEEESYEEDFDFDEEEEEDEEDLGKYN
jgi:hypothetical protein